MSQPFENHTVACEGVTPEIAEEWKFRATEETDEGRAWRNYILLLNTYAEAIRRAPTSTQACQQINILHYFNLECASLIDRLHTLLPNDVVVEKS